MKLCECGCGKPAPLAGQNLYDVGIAKGEPRRFVRGHNNRNRHIKSLRYVERDLGYDTPCWIWQLQIHENGYGSISVNRRPYRAHRWYWEQIHGPVPDGMVIDHLCRNRACVNPDHLEAVSHPENCHRGASTKLTAPEVLEIRRLIKEGTLMQVEIAARFGVSPATVTDIKKGRKWASLA